MKRWNRPPIQSTRFKKRKLVEDVEDANQDGPSRASSFDMSTCFDENGRNVLLVRNLNFSSKYATTLLRLAFSGGLRPPA